MMPAQRGDPEDPAPGHLEVVERRARPALADHERHGGRQRHRAQADGHRPLVRHRREVDREHQRRHQQDREDAAEVVDRVARLVHVRGHEAVGHVERHQGEGERDEEDRAPLEAGEQGAREQRAERRDRAAEGRPQRYRARARRPGPERGDQGERGGVGHPRRKAADQARAEQHLDRGRERGHQRGRDRQRRAQQQHQLAPVAIAQRAEVEHRGGQPERVADRHEVERGLARVERLADVRQRHVGHGEVQVRHRRHQDERDKHELRPCRHGRCLRCGRHRGHARPAPPGANHPVGVMAGQIGRSRIASRPIAASSTKRPAHDHCSATRPRYQLDRPRRETRRRVRRLRHHRRPGQGDDLPLALPPREPRPARLPDRRRGRRRLDGRGAACARTPVHPGLRRDDRRRDLRALLGAPVVPCRRLRRRRHLRTGRRRAEWRPEPRLLPRDTRLRCSAW